LKTLTIGWQFEGYVDFTLNLNISKSHYLKDLIS